MSLTMIKFLPENIKNHILSYHCRQQPNYLLEDISNFVESKKSLREFIMIIFETIWMSLICLWKTSIGL